MVEVYIGHGPGPSESEWTADRAKVDLTAGNRAALLAKAADAIAADLAYLALTPPTQAQVVTQMERLTRQVVALLRMVAGLLDDTNGT